jgi:hypothetical protein
LTQIDTSSFSCSACGRTFRWKPELAGKAVKCKCGQPIRVPKQAGGAAPAVAKAAAPRTSTHLPPPPPPPPPPPKPAKRETQEDDLDAIYALAEQESAAADEASAAGDTGRCPGCHNPLAPEAVLCTNCGFDRRRGSTLKVKVEDENAPKRRLFGLLSPKKEDPSKKKVVDKMAPQGSYFAGVGVSAGFAVCAAIVWFLVAYLADLDVYYLVLLVGAAAGVGMQIGQKGYSHLGGFTAAGITFATMLIARFAVVLAILMPNLKEAAMADEEETTAEERVETKGSKDMLLEHAARLAESAAEKRAAQQKNAPPPPPPEDPRVLSMLADQYIQEKGWSLQHMEGEQYMQAHNVAVARATTMPSVEKQKLIALSLAKRDKEELVELVWAERVEELRKDNPKLRPSSGGADEWARPRVEKMSAEEQKTELARLRPKMKTIFAQRAKEFEEEMEKEEAEEEAQAKAEAQAQAQASAAPPAADPDGLGGDPDGLGGGPATPTPVAAAAQPAATPNPPTPVASSSSSSSSSAADEDEGTSMITLGIGAILILIFFGGIKSFLFMLGSLFLAYRTAAGSTWD